MMLETNLFNPNSGVLLDEALVGGWEGGGRGESARTFYINPKHSEKLQELMNTQYTFFQKILLCHICIILSLL